MITNNQYPGQIISKFWRVIGAKRVIDSSHCWLSASAQLANGPVIALIDELNLVNTPTIGRFCTALAKQYQRARHIFACRILKCPQGSRQLVSPPLFLPTVNPMPLPLKSCK